MKASYRNQRKGCSAKHNDRTNITYNQEKECENELYVMRVGREEFSRMRQNKNGTMEKNEIQQYTHMFRSWLKKRNAKEQKNRHPDRVKTMEEIYHSDRYCPEETIYQVGAGNQGNDLKDKEKFKKILFKTLEREQKEFPQVKILSVSIHADEEVLHAHVRKMYITKSQEPGMEKALEEMGIERPEPNQKSGRYNNRKMTYTEQTREIWYDEIEKELGIMLDRTVKEPSKKHKSKLEHECDQLELHLNELKTSIEEFGDLNVINKQKQSKLSQIKQINENIQKELNHRTSDALRDRCAYMEQYLHQKGLWEEYQQFRDYLEERENDYDY